MNKNLILKTTESFVKKALSGEGTGHDWWHIERVRNNAHSINLKEKGDDFVIEQETREMERRIFPNNL